jgi:hypothetical protein
MTKLTTPAASAASSPEALEAREYLLNILRPGNYVYTSVHDVNRTGTARHIKVGVVVTDEQYGPRMENIAGKITDLLGYKYVPNGSGSVYVQGVGMDMTEFVVMRISEALFGAQQRDALKAIPY